MENVLFEFYRGDTYQRDFTIKGWSLPISKIFFTVKENAEYKNHVLQKSLINLDENKTENNGITLVDKTDDMEVYNLTICCTDTERMKANFDYEFDIEIHSDGVNGDLIKRTIVTGKLRLKASSTKACNEC